ncbi:MAG: aminoacyl-tRNA hydrolase [Bacteroidales bacterium]|nr:aminoacyl-tRNA hydrolase [Bacteroidales bacterium]
MKYLVVGLGNIGEKFHNTRHNIGFVIADALAASGEATFASVRYGALAQMKYRGRQLLILKPSTYMNLSGKAAKYWVTKEDIPLENLLVISDDIDLDMGVLRMKAKGSGGSHNGMNNIIEELESTNFPRLRFGIGRNFAVGRKMDFVLGKWEPEEEPVVEERKKIAVEMIKNFVMAGVNDTMCRYNKAH